MEEAMEEEVGLRGRRSRQQPSPTTTIDDKQSLGDRRAEVYLNLKEVYKKGGAQPSPTTTIDDKQSLGDRRAEVCLNLKEVYKKGGAQPSPTTTIDDKQSLGDRRAEVYLNLGEVYKNGGAQPSPITTIDDKQSLGDRRAEVSLEEVYKKGGAHKFFCPSCNSCIEKVIVQELESASDDTNCTFTCTSCFSFLIRTGDGIFRKKEPRRTARDGKDTQDIQPDGKMEGDIDAKKGDTDSPNNSLAGQTKPQPMHDDATSPVGKHQREPDGKDTQDIQPDGKMEGDIDAKKGDTDSPNNSLAGQTKPQPMHDDSTSPVGKHQREPDDKDTQDIQPDGQMEDDIDAKKGDTGIYNGRNSLLPRAGEDDSESQNEKKMEILKSVVFGGLTESITSLTIVTSAASADATTAHIVALALANLVGGFFIIGHNLRELKNEEPRGTSDHTDEQVDRYQEQLGQRQNFILHATVALLSFLIFGLVPPVVYGFSFRKSDNKDYKIAAVAAASLLCIVILAICKAYVKKPPKNYLKTLMYYAVAGIMASGASYVAGYLMGKLIKNLGWFKSEATVSIPLVEMSSWASY